MRLEKFILFMIGILVLALGWMVISPPTWLPQVASTISSMVSPSSAGKTETPSEPKNKPSPTKKEATSRPQERRAAPEATAAPSTAMTAATPRAVQAPRRFPSATEIRRMTGAARSEIVTAFGSPDATVVGADRQLQERLVYVDAATGRKTMIFIVDGRVTGAETYTP